MNIDEFKTKWASRGGISNRRCVTFRGGMVCANGMYLQSVQETHNGRSVVHDEVVLFDDIGGVMVNVGNIRLKAIMEVL